MGSQSKGTGKVIAGCVAVIGLLASIAGLIAFFALDIPDIIERWFQMSTQAPISRPTPTYRPANTEIYEIPEVPNPQPTQDAPGVRNPTEPVPLGTAILSDDYSLTVTGYDVHDSGNETVIGVRFIVENIGTQTHLLRFKRASVMLTDDLGVSYPLGIDLLLGNRESMIYENLEVSLDAGQVVTFASTEIWLGSTDLAYFKGPISYSASKIYVGFEGFGPFSGVSVEIDL